MSTASEGPVVALIGPVLPFRGGIAQHTTMLHRALSTSGDAVSVSFTRLYPRSLFPGESDRDPAFEGHEEPGVSYLIDSLAPWTWRKAVRHLAAQGVDLAVIPWWTFFWAPLTWYLTRALRKRGIEVVLFCHNVVDHEVAAWKTALTRRVLSKASRFVVQTRADAARLESLLPGMSVAVHPHPVYEQFPDALGTLERRAETELLFFGFVRPYKGLDILIEAMHLLAGDDVMLTVAGEFWEGEEATRSRVAELRIEDKVEIVSAYLEEAQVAEYFDRADIVVLPYRDATGSGVVPLAYNYDRPVIVTDVGGLPDVVEDGRTGILVPPEDPAAVAAAVRDLASWDRTQAQEAVHLFKSTLTWESLAKTVLSGSDQ